MNCQEIQDILLDCSPGERSALDSPDVQAHVAGCPACRDEIDRLEGLWARVAELPSEIPLTGDQWPGVRDRLDSRKVLPFRQFQRFAEWAPRLAAAALLMFAGAGVDRWMTRTAPSPAAAEIHASVDTSSETTVVKVADVDRGRAGWVEARTQLWGAALTRGDSTLTEEALDGLLEGLAAVEEARTGLEIALAAHPEDGRILALLQKTRRRELSLLRKLASPPRPRPVADDDVTTHV